jgi:hypothetical protein
VLIRTHSPIRTVGISPRATKRCRWRLETARRLAASPRVSSCVTCVDVRIRDLHEVHMHAVKVSLHRLACRMENKGEVLGGRFTSMGRQCAARGLHGANAPAVKV